MLTNRKYRVLGWGLVIAFSIMLSACSGLFSEGYKEDETPVVVILGPTASGDTWEVLISVSGVTEGLTGILIEDGGILTDGIDESSIVATGLNGFFVSAQDFTLPTPYGTVIAVKAGKGVSSGRVVSLTFHTESLSPSLTLDKSKVTLLTEQGAVVAAWELTRSGAEQ